MKRSATLIATLMLPILGVMSKDVIAEAGSNIPDPGWHIIEDSISGPVLVYRDADERLVARLECVGPSAVMPLLYADRPFNLVLSLQTRLATSWSQGREVFALVRGPDGWKRADVMAVGTRLIIGPQHTDRAMTATDGRENIEVRLVGNTRSGIIEERITLPLGDLPAWRREQVDGCARVYD